MALDWSFPAVGLAVSMVSRLMDSRGVGSLDRRLGMWVSWDPRVVTHNRGPSPTEALTSELGVAAVSHH